MSYVVGIDLGTTKVVTVVGQKLPTGYVKILTYCEVPSQGIVYGAVSNILSVQTIVQKTLDKIRTEMKINIDEVFVGIAGQHVKYVETGVDMQRQKHDEPITVEEVNELTSMAYGIMLEPGEEIIHVIPHSYTIDDFAKITDPIGHLGWKISGHFSIMIGKSMSIHCTRMCLKNLDLQLKKLVLEPVASAMAVLRDDEKNMGVVMVDMGGGTTDLVVIINNIIEHVAVIPMGGDIITADIQKAFGILPHQAENIKINLGSCMASNAMNVSFTLPGIGNRDCKRFDTITLANVIESRMCEIIDMVMLEIRNFDRNLRTGTGIVFTGGGAQMKHLCEYVALKTGMQVEIGSPKFISSDSPQGIVHPKYSTAIGLLMYAFDKSDNYSGHWDLINNIGKIAATNTKNADTKNVKLKQPIVKQPKHKVIQYLQNFFTDRAEQEDV